jgi:GNAT superfamily N-acetyltransferase
MQPSPSIDVHKSDRYLQLKTTILSLGGIFMSARAVEAPDDFDVMLALIHDGFQYPENETWSIQTDKMESIADEFTTMKRLWSVLRVFALLFPALREIMRGFVWEEDGKPVGLVNVSPKGLDESAWTIGNVVVLPEYRRRGIARQLIEQSIGLARSKSADTVMLDVIGGNFPAVKLYESLGFERYGGRVEIEHEPISTPPPPLSFPTGYSLIKTSPKDWQMRYDFVKRITPLEIQQYEPVKEKNFHKPLIIRPIRYLFLRFSSSIGKMYLLRHDQSGEIVAQMRYWARKKEGGINEMDIMLDPAHAHLAEYLVNMMTREIVTFSPGRRIETFPATWQNVMIEALLTAGFLQRCEGYLMGKKL